MMTPKQREALVEQSDSAELYILTFGSTILRFTSYFQYVDVDGYSYEAVPVQRGGVSFSADLSDITTTITIAATTDIAALFKANSQVQQATIEIRKYFLADMSDYGVVFAGYIKKSKIGKGEVELTCSSRLDPINREFPRIRAQTRCNNILYDAFCGVLTATWKITGTVATVSGTLVTVTFTLPGGYPFTPASGFFTYGRCMKTGTTNWRGIISDSTSAGMTSIVMHFPLNELAVGNSIDLYPGCNKSYNGGYEISSCPNSCLSFNNTARFLGMEHIPYKNPTITPVLT